MRRTARTLLPLAVALAIAGRAAAQPPADAPGATRYTVADFYRNSQFFGASWAPDRRTILVSSNLSGIWNAYAVPVAGGAPRPLTTSTTNSVFATSYFPADERILYSSDEGGNELAHLFVRFPDGTTRDLTPGDRLQASFLGWSGDGRRFFIATNERDERYFDLYEVSADRLERTRVYTNTQGFDIGRVSRDGRRVALVRTRTVADADIYLHDLRTGATTNVTAHTGAVRNAPAAFSPDGARLLFISDQGREFASLRSYDLATGAVTPVYEQPWDVDGAEYSPGGGYLVVYVNQDARGTARVLHAATFAPVVNLGLPDGVVRGVAFSPDDSAVAFYATDGSVPDELYAGAPGAAPVRLTDALNPAIRRQDLVVPAVVRFRSYDGTEIPGLLYTPHGASPAARAPAVVLVHGGPGGQAQVGYSGLVQALANHGYVVFDINNRGSSGYGKTFFGMDDRRHGEADLGDVVASKGMLVGTGYVDPARIGILGGSYGGYMVLAALTLQPDAFRTGVDLFGPSNWVRTLQSVPASWASFRDALYAELGDPQADSVRLRRISPIFHADRIRVPLMVLQGANDPRVLQVESDEIVAAARRNGVPVEYVVFPDEGHGFVKKENEIRGYTAVLRFLDRYLAGAPETPGEARP
jgi:dipeptidyl aminopeptidase/acylaminoacyl peptidase